MNNTNEDIKANQQNEEADKAEDIKEEVPETKDASDKEAAVEGNEGGSTSEETQEDESTRYMRLMADFQNFKKRAAKEKTDLYQYANEKIMTELLEVLDNFERALQQEVSDNGFKEGMELIFKQMFDVLEKSGLAEIAALGEDFDPNFHNAVMTEESEEYESGKVSEVLQKGYTLNGKVIRPTMVKVVG